LGSYCCARPDRASAGRLDESFPSQISLADFVRGIAKIKVRRAFTIDLTHAQVANATMAQGESFVHLCYQHDLRRAPIEGHGSGRKSAKDVDNNGGARSFLGPLQEASETDFISEERRVGKEWRSR